MAGWNASIDLFWVVSYAEKLITLSFCSCDAFLTPFQRWFASAYTFCTLFDNFRTDRPRGSSAAITRILRGRCTDYPRWSARLSARNNHGILRKKLSFPCHVPYMCVRSYVFLCVYVCMLVCVLHVPVFNLCLDFASLDVVSIGFQTMRDSHPWFNLCSIWLKLTIFFLFLIRTCLQTCKDWTQRVLVQCRVEHLYPGETYYPKHCAWIRESQ